MQTQQSTAPQPNVLFGLTHDIMGQPIVRTPRTLKVGIGTPSGKDIYVYIGADGQWVVRMAKNNNLFKTKAEAQKFYATAFRNAPEVKYPSKTPFFVFTQLGGSGMFEPAWDAIEKHGPMPTEIDIVFTDDQPFDAAYRMWSALGLQCHGDGVMALRRIEMAKTEEELEAAEIAKAHGDKFFPIVRGCHTCGCSYAENIRKGDRILGPLCKPNGSLSFQLLNSPTLGGKASFTTTSYRSIANLFSCLQEFFRITGQGDPRKGFVAGIPLKLVLRPHKVKPEGQAPSTAYSVSLEFRAEDVYSLHQKLIGAGVKFRETAHLAPPVPRQIAAPVFDDDVLDVGNAPVEDVDEGIPAEAMAAEFYPEAQFPDEDGTAPAAEHGPDTPPPTASEQVQAKTESKGEAVKETLRKRQAKAAAAPPPAQAAQATAVPLMDAQADPLNTERKPGLTEDPFKAADEAFQW